MSKDRSLAQTRYGNITLTKEEEQEFQEIFNLVDLDGGGSISKAELGQLFNTLNLRVTPQELDLMVHEIDENNDGEIQFDEFVKVMARKVNATYTAQEVKKAFKVFEPQDASGNSTSKTPGVINIRHLAASLKVYASERLSQEQVADLVKQLEAVADKDGNINYMDYVQMMMGE